MRPSLVIVHTIMEQSSARERKKERKTKTKNRLTVHWTIAREPRRLLFCLISVPVTTNYIQLCFFFFFIFVSFTPLYFMLVLGPSISASICMRMFVILSVHLLAMAFWWLYDGTPCALINESGTRPILLMVPRRCVVAACLPSDMCWSKVRCDVSKGFKRKTHSKRQWRQPLNVSKMINACDTVPKFVENSSKRFPMANIPPSKYSARARQ